MVDAETPLFNGQREGVGGGGGRQGYESNLCL